MAIISGFSPRALLNHQIATGITDIVDRVLQGWHRAQCGPPGVNEFGMLSGIMMSLRVQGECPMGRNRSNVEFPARYVPLISTFTSARRSASETGL